MMALACGPLRAESAASAESAAFTFDAAYPASGLSPADWDVREVMARSGLFTVATAARATDADGNGIPDWWEALYGLAGVDARAEADPDGDGWTNLQEYNAGMNPVVADDFGAAAAVSARWLVDTWIDAVASGGGSLSEVWALASLFVVDTVGRAPDTDHDGLPDAWERAYGLNPLVADADLDPDGDGWTNLQEFNAGTHPLVADDWTRAVLQSSRSFTADTRIAYSGGQPIVGEAFEVRLSGNGFVCDTGGLYYDWDGDGIPNWWEARFSRDGSKTGLAASGDDDGDGMSNYGEFVAYTDPTNRLSKFVVGLEPISVVPAARAAQAPRLMSAAPAASGDGFALTWRSAVGRTYSVFVCDDLSRGWPSSPVAELAGTGDELVYVPEQVRPSRFFRVTVRLSE